MNIKKKKKKRIVQVFSFSLLV